MSSSHDAARDIDPRYESDDRDAAERDRSSGSAETRERLLDAAERLFADHGFEGASMRAITQAAGTSVSAANYHFGSKAKLLHETIRRATEPVNARRVELLEEARARAGDAPIELEDILDAFLRPTIDLRRSDVSERGRQVGARLFSDPPELIQSVKLEIFGPMSQRFVEALTQALPGRPRVSVDLGYQFLIAIMVYVISDQIESSTFTSAHPEGVDDDELLQRMIEFAAAGLRALPPA